MIEVKVGDQVFIPVPHHGWSDVGPRIDKKLAVVERLTRTQAVCKDELGFVIRFHLKNWWVVGSTFDRVTVATEDAVVAHKALLEEKRLWSRAYRKVCKLHEHLSTFAGRKSLTLAQLEHLAAAYDILVEGQTA